MDKILRYLLKGIGILSIITIVPAFMITTLIIMLSSLLQKTVWLNEVILPKWIGITFFIISSIIIIIVIGKLSEMEDAISEDSE